MQAIILDAIRGKHEIQDTLKRIQDELKLDYEYFKLEEKNIKPCMNCGGCNYKTPGKCVVKDDASEILYEVMHGDILILLNPITFGGYSSNLKKILDKFALLGCPLFEIRKGRLQHLISFPGHERKGAVGCLLAIGISNEQDEEQKASFSALIDATCDLMDARHKTLNIDGKQITPEVYRFIKESLQEVIGSI